MDGLEEYLFEEQSHSGNKEELLLIHHHLSPLFWVA